VYFNAWMDTLQIYKIRNVIYAAKNVKNVQIITIHAFLVIKIHFFIKINA
jgi:hypothetical protein